MWGLSAARARALAPTLLAVAVAASLASPARALGTGPSHGPARHGHAGHSAGQPQAPSGPPLVSGENAYSYPAASGSEEEEAARRQAPGNGSDPLVQNGLRSPLCSDPGNELSPAALHNCAVSGFAASSAPTTHYELDADINKGALGVSLPALMQETVIEPPWMAIVWSVHIVLDALIWAFQLNLLGGATVGVIGGLLRSAQHTFTHPWLVALLCVAAVALAYRGIVKRRVADSLGEVLVMLAMIAAGLWMIMDPVGTVGVASSWAGEASLQTLDAVSAGSVARPQRMLAEDVGAVFAATVNAPWCFMEFGNVAWCESPARLSPRLHAVAMRIDRQLRAEAQARGGVPAWLQQSTEMLRGARTNGALFLAFPPNKPARNSGTEPGTLLHALCGGENDTHCHGPTAHQAEFRNGSGTVDRIIGLLAIAAGVLGMLLTLGFVVMRLLGAAIMSLVLLLAAPIVVLAPAIGEGGRATFRSWLTRLFSAIASKLIWSFLLGVLLATMKLLLSLDRLGWWVQWLLLGILWWSAFLHRHRLLAAGGGFLARDGAPTLVDVPIGTARRGARAGRRAGRAGWRSGRWVGRQFLAKRRRKEAEERRRREQEEYRRRRRRKRKPKKSPTSGQGQSQKQQQQQQQQKQQQKQKKPRQRKRGQQQQTGGSGREQGKSRRPPQPPPGGSPTAGAGERHPPKQPSAPPPQRSDSSSAAARQPQPPSDPSQIETFADAVAYLERSGRGGAGGPEGGRPPSAARRDRAEAQDRASAAGSRAARPAPAAATPPPTHAERDPGAQPAQAEQERPTRPDRKSPAPAADDPVEEVTRRRRRQLGDQRSQEWD